MSFELYFSHVAKIACLPKELATLQSAPKLYHGLVVKMWNKGHRTIMMGKFYRSRKSRSLSSTLTMRKLCTLITNQKPANFLPGDRLDPAQDLRQCEGPGDVDQGITSFLDFDKYISKVGEGVDVGKFTCNICGQIGAQKGNIRRHVESIHFPGQLEYSCTDCEVKFDTKTKYLKHQSKKHSNTY